MKTKIATLIFVSLITINLCAQKKGEIKEVSYQCNFDCPSCETKVMKNLPYEKGVKNVSVDYEKRLVKVEYKEGKNTDEGIKLALEQLGYETSIPSKAKMFYVNGNCGMCKTKIEEAAKSIDGVSNASWDMETKNFTVSFDESKTNLEALHNAIAKVGYDTDQKRADDEVYNNLHACCKYERKE